MIIMFSTHKHTDTHTYVDTHSHTHWHTRSLIVVQIIRRKVKEIQVKNDWRLFIFITNCAVCRLRTRPQSKSELWAQSSRGSCGSLWWGSPLLGRLWSARVQLSVELTAWQRKKNTVRCEWEILHDELESKMSKEDFHEEKKQNTTWL